MSRRRACLAAGSLLLLALPSPTLAGPRVVRWMHLSTKTGDLQPPNAGDQQTSAAVADFDGDGVNDFVVTERTKAPSVVLYRRAKAGWDRLVIDATPQHIEAGSEAFDVDGDGDQDLLVGGDWMSNRVWWYENPSPKLEPDTPWASHVVKDSGATKHHDQVFGDFDGDGRAELAFWNQGGRALYVCAVPAKPATVDRWPCSAIYTWSADGEMLQRQTKPYPAYKAVNEHEGLATADVDGDGRLDLVGGGRWFRHEGGTRYAANVIDASYQFTRSGAGQLVEGGRPEVVLTVGDGWAPLVLYEWQRGTWVPRVVLPEVDSTHSLRLVDFDRDGHLDIWAAEMRLDGGNPDAKNQILFGDGKGGFEPVVISEGIDLHESEIADLDGDGDLDVLGKPYNWEAPRLDVWINEGPEPAPIVFLSAIDAEFRPIVDALADRETLTVRGLPCVAGTLAGRRAVVAVSGVGKVNAATATALLIERFSPAAVIFSGVAGALDPNLQPGDVVIGETLVQHDLVYHTEEGAVPRSVRNPLNGTENPIALPASPRLLALARQVADRAELEPTGGDSRAPRVLMGTIATGDSFVGSRAKRAELWNDLGAHAVEMEGAAVAQVCYQHGVPFLVVRGLSDRAGSDARTEARRHLEVAARNAARAALAVGRRLASEGP